jgi:hypothetical protein
MAFDAPEGEWMDPAGLSESAASHPTRSFSLPLLERPTVGFGAICCATKFFFDHSSEEMNAH